MKRQGSLHPARSDWWPLTKRPRATAGGLIAAQRDMRGTPGECAPVLAHVPSFGRNPRGSPDFLAYPVPKACQQRCFGTWVPWCLGVAHAASSLKAAQALGCSLSPLAPGHVWPGHLNGTGCLSARAMDTELPNVVWRLC